MVCLWYQTDVNKMKPTDILFIKGTFSVNAILFEQKCTETSSRQYCTKIYDSLQYWIVSYSCEQNVLLLTTAKEIYLSYSFHVVNEWFRFILFINFKLPLENSILGFSN